MLWRAILAIVLACGTASGQALAHKNWAGNGMTVAPWWAGAELYEIDPIDFQDADGNGFGDLRGIADRLDYLQALGVDGLVLSNMPLRVGGTGVQPFEEMYGSEEDFDRLVQEATRRKLRVLVDVALSARESTTETLAAGRFWLTRGVAGLRLVRDMNGAALTTTQQAERVRELKRLCAGFAGQRVLVSDGVSREGVELVEDKRLVGLKAPRAFDLRAALAASGDGTVVMTESSERIHDDALAKSMAAVLLLGRGAPLLYFGQELGMAGSAAPEPMQWGAEHGFTTGTPWIAMGPNAASANVQAEDADPASLLNWYRKLGTLRHASAALRTGVTEVQSGNSDAVVWVRRDRRGDGPAVVVVVNPTARAVYVPLPMGPLRMLAASYAFEGEGVGHGVTVPPYGVFIGEQRRSAGLETGYR